LILDKRALQLGSPSSHQRVLFYVLWKNNFDFLDKQKLSSTYLLYLPMAPFVVWHNILYYITHLSIYYVNHPLCFLVYDKYTTTILGNE